MFISTLTLRNVDYLRIVAVMLLFALSLASANVMADDDEIDIDKASWSDRRDRLTVEGDKVPRNATVTIRYGEKDDNGAVIGTTRADDDGDWKFRIRDIDPVPCDVTAIAGGDDDDKEVRRAPRNCSNDGGSQPPANEPPTADANGPYTGTKGVAVNFSSTGSSDSDGTIDSYAWTFGDGATSSAANPNHSYADTGTYNVRLEVTDNDGDTDSDSTTATISDGQPPANVPPTANANGPYTGTTGVEVNFSSAGSNDSDGTIASYAWSFGDGGSSNNANPNHSYASAGTYNVTLTVTDNDGASDSASTSATITDVTPPAAQCDDGIDNDNDGFIDMLDPGCSSPSDNDEFNLPPAPIPNVSINSTSVNGVPGGTAVAEQTFAGQAGYTLLSINDLGMHCGDFDTRISSILPPFNITHTHVIQKGSNPTILTPADGIEVVYSASSNPNDPILTGINSAGTGPVYSSMLADGSVFKTNFWDSARSAYDPFYPSGVLPVFYGPMGDPIANILDLGLPMPNVERWYLGDGVLAAEQQEMPGVAMPYSLNDPLATKTFSVDQPFFTTFPFGYTSRSVDWFEQAGIPITAFDDFGRENPWALMRVQAKAGGQTLASLDTVLPISGEANCGFCHGASVDGGNGAGTQALEVAGIPVASSLDDPEFGNVPDEVSKEYAADLNLVRLHDLEHGTTLEAQTPVVCQQCHYTPALDLAQFGPLGPENDSTNITINVDIPGVYTGPFDVASLANGRDQVKHKSMSNVMHSHHATVTDTSGNTLFPSMPPAIDNNGNLRDATLARGILEETCYQCHPGRRTDCLRGAMANGGMLCQDCHGDMEQVGNDFTRNVTLATPGAFELGPDFYDPNSATPRVPWANEPGCGSCHTGDVNDSLYGTTDTLDAPDGVRLLQAFKVGDAKATPIVPTNKRFAENVITAADNPMDAAAIGNPMLYRVSNGHGGVMCEGCHGATHGIWPNKNPAANDNVAAIQLQGHTGTIIECSTCHGSSMDNANTLNGPHGMHPVGNDQNVSSGSAAGPQIDFVDGGHSNLSDNISNCTSCHGTGDSRKNLTGSVLAVAKKDRMLDGQLIPAGTEIRCTICH